MSGTKHWVTMAINAENRIKYQEKFSEFVGTFSARAFGLGRQALVILLKAIGVKPGDRVGVCSFTCLSVLEAIKVCEALPVYLDIDEYLCIDPKSILSQPTNSLKVIVLQHTFGSPGKLDILLSVCKKIGAKVVEDCAHSFGCFWKGQPLGQFGEGAIYCSQWGKPYSTGQGGMLTINSERLLKEVDRQIENWASSASKKSELILECQRKFYAILNGLELENSIRNAYINLRDFGFVKGSFNLNCDFHLYGDYIRFMGEMTAQAGLEQLKNWPKLQQLRRENTEMIEALFCEQKLALWPKPAEADITMLRYPVIVSNKSEILRQARKHRLDIGGWYMSPVHPLQGAELTKVDYEIGRCQNAENMISRLVHLPTGGGVNKKKLKAMVEIISNISSQN
jgi:dTDP-4-amino-4,6-dideoxygalactose transaminase